MEEKDRKGMLQLNVAGAAEVLPPFLFPDTAVRFQISPPFICIPFTTLAMKLSRLNTPTWHMYSDITPKLSSLASHRDDDIADHGRELGRLDRRLLPAHLKRDPFLHRQSAER